MAQEIDIVVSPKRTESGNPNGERDTLSPPLLVLDRWKSPILRIWHIRARRIWSSEMSLKRSCKMQFRHVGHYAHLSGNGKKVQNIEPKFVQAEPAFLLNSKSAQFCI